MTRPGPPILVVGAGPTGLTMAAQIHAHGGQVRIIDRRRQRRQSRAFVVHPRTLEVLAPLAVVDTLIARGDPSATAVVRAGGRRARVTLARPGITDTRYPFLLAIPQVVVEEVLEKHLAQQGIPVERGVEFISIAQQQTDSVTCILRRGDGEPYFSEASYLVGCDGADSTVRESAGIPFPYRDYHPKLLMANLDADGPLEPGAVNGYLGADGILFLFPSPEAAAWRLLTVNPDHRADDNPLDLPALQAVTDRFTGGTLRLRDLDWATTIRLRRGQATHYHTKRVLLAGDAAHLHSPAGAQGMNTGIQDACNLGWKLALVATGLAMPQLLSSYQAERWPVARRVRQLTDLAFLAEAGSLPPIGLLRRHLAPLLLPLLHGRTLPAGAFRFIGGLHIRYRGSPAVEDGDRAPLWTVHAGDRLPNGRVTLGGEEHWLHDLLQGSGFHVLLCGRPDEFDPWQLAQLRGSFGTVCAIQQLARVPEPGVPADQRGELLRRLGGGTATYLVRPDRYVGYRSRGPDLSGLIGHLRELLPGLQPSSLVRG